MTLHADDAGPTTEAPPVEPAPRPRSRWLSLSWQNPLADPLSAAVLSVVLFFVGFGGGLARLRAPLGLGDVIPAYAVARMWSQGSFFGNNDFGYPFGFELRYFPTSDITQNLVAAVVGALTRDPFLALNTVYLLSFPFTALAALWVLRLAGLRGPMAVLTSLALTFIPFHWLRTEHLYLASMYSAVLGVGLALAIGSGAIERALRGPHRARSVVALLLVALVVGTSGIYYTFFAIVLCGVALVVRFARGAPWRALVAAAVWPAAVVVFFGLALLPAVLFERANPALEAVAKRLPVESVIYSGSVSYALMPAPHSKIPGFGVVNSAVNSAAAEAAKVGTSGVLLPSNFGTLFTCLAIALTVVGLVVTARRRALGSAPVEPRDRVTFGLVGALLATAVLFFVPWGLNFLFATFVSTQIRAWDRMIPVLFTLVFAAAAVAWRSLRLPMFGWRVTLVAAVGGVLLVLDSVAPYRATFGQLTAAGMAQRTAGEEYAAELNGAVPGECAVLQLPVLEYPEEPPRVGLWNLDQFWPALTNPAKRWSAGAIKGTEDSAWQDGLQGDLEASTLQRLAEGDFCAIHVDARGYTPEEHAALLDHLTELAGDPVATGHNGDWTAFRMPGWEAGAPDPSEDLDDLSDDDQLFYAPVTVQRTDELAAPEVDAEGQKVWWIGSGEGTFDVTAPDPLADFTDLSVEVTAASCAARDVTVTLTSDSGSATRTVELAADESARVLLSLDAPATSARLVVDPTGTGCTSADRAVAMSRPIASFPS